jgi:hypothetical protein
MDRGDPIFKITTNTGVSKNSIYELRKKAISYRWLSSILIEPRYIDDRPWLGRLRVSMYITAAILTTLTRNLTSRGFLCLRIIREVSFHLPRKQFVLASTVYRILIAKGYGSYKRIVKPGLNKDNKKKRLAWYIEYLIENRWDLKK